MNLSSQMTISITDLEKVYAVVKKLNDLISSYKCDLKALKVHQEDKLFFCSGLSAERIRIKIQITKCLLEIYTHKYRSFQVNEKSSSDEILFYSVIPSLNELSISTSLSVEKLCPVLKQIAYDFVKAFDSSHKIFYKTISIAFLVSEKSLNAYLLKNGLRTKHYYNVEQKKQAAEARLQGKSYKQIEELTGVHKAAAQKASYQILRDEAELNSFAGINIDHNEAIRAIGKIAQERGFFVYSEHIADFNTNIGDNFRNIDLLLLKSGCIHCAIEVEKSNGLKKSISNLINNFKDVKFKILFVSEKALPKAYAIRREKGITASEVKIIKLHEGFENTLIRLISPMRTR